MESDAVVILKHWTLKQWMKGDALVILIFLKLELRTPHAD